MEKLWKTLTIGDKVRIVTWPIELNKDLLHAETIGTYEWLVTSGEILTIDKIDECGLPFGRVSRSLATARLWEFVALNHSGIEIVSRKRGKNRNKSTWM